MEQPLTSNVFDTALVFEGGGMRASYTAAVVATLLKERLFFDHVSGISAKQMYRYRAASPSGV